jgi:hypothetical protein
MHFLCWGGGGRVMGVNFDIIPFNIAKCGTRATYTCLSVRRLFNRATYVNIY